MMSWSKLKPFGSKNLGQKLSIEILNTTTFPPSLGGRCTD